MISSFRHFPFGSFCPGLFHPCTSGKAGVPAEAPAHRYATPEKFESLKIVVWGFPIRPAITKLCKEWQGKKA